MNDLWKYEIRHRYMSLLANKKTERERKINNILMMIEYLSTDIIFVIHPLIPPISRELYNLIENPPISRELYHKIFPYHYINPDNSDIFHKPDNIFRIYKYYISDNLEKESDYSFTIDEDIVYFDKDIDINITELKKYLSIDSMKTVNLLMENYNKHMAFIQKCIKIRHELQNEFD